MTSIVIKLKDGKWLVNDKPYSELGGLEKIFFDEFLIAARIISEQKQKQ